MENTEEKLTLLLVSVQPNLPNLPTDQTAATPPPQALSPNIGLVPAVIPTTGLTVVTTPPQTPSPNNATKPAGVISPRQLAVATPPLQALLPYQMTKPAVLITPSQPTVLTPPPQAPLPSTLPKTAVVVTPSRPDVAPRTPRTPPPNSLGEATSPFYWTPPPVGIPVMSPTKVSPPSTSSPRLTNPRMMGRGLYVWKPTKNATLVPGFGTQPPPITRLQSNMVTTSPVGGMQTPPVLRLTNPTPVASSPDASQEGSYTPGFRTTPTLHPAPLFPGGARPKNVSGAKPQLPAEASIPPAKDKYVGAYVSAYGRKPNKQTRPNQIRNPGVRLHF